MVKGSVFSTYYTQELIKIDDTLCKIIFDESELQIKVDELTKMQNTDVEKFKSLKKEHERLLKRSWDAADACDDRYSCAGAGAYALQLSIEMKIIRDKIAELKPKVSRRSKNLNDLDKNLRSSIAKHKELRKAFEKAIGELSKLK